MRSHAAIGVLSIALLGACAKETLVHGQEERAANHIVLVLMDDAHIRAETSKQEATGHEPRYDVIVAKEDRDAALKVIEKHNLPERPRAGAQQVFGDTGIIPSPVSDRARLVSATEGDLEYKLRRIENVVGVEAFVAMPER